jgi:S-adenosylmethionine hydrolase
MSIITLLTDFGNRDEYVGLMKGVILSINPSVTIVDITHQIDNQDIAQAAFAIYSAYRYFPAGSVHLIVVDPGVGTGRSLLATEMNHQYFIAPDNGVLTLIFDDQSPTKLIRLTNTDFFLKSVSRTFHGRDIIAPVGAHITRGIELHEFGEEITSNAAVRLEGIRPLASDEGEIIGTIVAVDHFGNLITNIGDEQLARGNRKHKGKPVKIIIGSHTINGIDRTYGNGPPEKPLALIGSRGYLEIAVNKGRADRTLNVRKGDTVKAII